MSRSLYNSVGGFDQSVKVGFPEDLDFFYRALNSGAELFKVCLCVQLQLRIV